MTWINFRKIVNIQPKKWIEFSDCFCYSHMILSLYVCELKLLYCYYKKKGINT